MSPPLPGRHSRCSSPAKRARARSLARAVHRLARTARGLCGGQCGRPRRSGVFRHPVWAYAGAFTGADRPRDGLITRAEDGTLFLDEIGDGGVSQVKLLRLLQEGTYYPLGADRPRQSRPVWW